MLDREEEMNKTIAVTKGDGIGVEIVDEALKVLNKVAEKYGHEFEYKYALIGGAAYDKYHTPLPEETLEICKASDAVFLGAVGGDKWDNVEPDLRPEKGLLALRKGLSLYANLRPATIYEALKSASPLKDYIVEKGVDILVVRELIGGIYFGDRKTYVEDGVRTAYDVEKYNENEIKRISKMAFDSAMKRRKKVTLVDKANVLDSSKLWREVVKEMAKDYPEVELDFMYVDNASMQLVKNPSQFDVILTNNIFGDILSDESSQITGSIGMLPSASISEIGIHMYEPIHGSAPDIAGQDIANPLATILSVAMMLRYSFDLEEEAIAIEKAVEKVLEEGIRTIDIKEPNGKYVKCSEIGTAVAERI